MKPQHDVQLAPARLQHCTVCVHVARPAICVGTDSLLTEMHPSETAIKTQGGLPTGSAVHVLAAAGPHASGIAMCVLPRQHAFQVKHTSR